MFLKLNKKRKIQKFGGTNGCEARDLEAQSRKFGQNGQAEPASFVEFGCMRRLHTSKHWGRRCHDKNAGPFMYVFLAFTQHARGFLPPFQPSSGMHGSTSSLPLYCFQASSRYVLSLPAFYAPLNHCSPHQTSIFSFFARLCTMQFSSLIMFVALLLVHCHLAHATFVCDNGFTGVCIRNAVTSDAKHPSIAHIGQPGVSVIRMCNPFQKKKRKKKSSDLFFVTPAHKQKATGNYSCTMHPLKDFTVSSTTRYCCRLSGGPYKRGTRLVKEERVPSPLNCQRRDSSPRPPSRLSLPTTSPKWAVSTAAALLASPPPQRRLRLTHPNVAIGQFYFILFLRLPSVPANWTISCSCCVSNFFYYFVILNRLAKDLVLGLTYEPTVPGNVAASATELVFYSTGVPVCDCKSKIVRLLVKFPGTGVWLVRMALRSEVTVS
ncbi:hypothetical protein VP01_303g1 [Puccinia sorghi]|uniref:Uncharacterized protein n=1 Tax=Puccinia sorghi TaxID=27349 RepID=A0A0L6UZZ6_9BASI|nr:hypothetical protein VP01_303g1 [Puccinia sorghi]